MKKFYCCLIPLTLLLSLALPVSVQAGTQNNTLISTGYTESGIYYEIYGDSVSVQQNSSGFYVTKTVVYDGEVTPPLTISWQEYINGLSYTGILHLSSSTYSPKTNKTTAAYQDTISPE